MKGIVMRLIVILALLLPLAAEAQGSPPPVGPVPQAMVGAPGGVAPLDSSGHVPIASIPIGSTASTVPSGAMLASEISTARANEALAIASGAVAAAGTTQGTATPVTKPTTIITGGAANAGILLVAAIPGNRILNMTAVTILIYPPVGGVLNAQAANLPVALLAGSSVTIGSADGVNWSAA